MTKTALKEKVLNMEAELEIIKKAINKEPVFDVDERIWKELRGAIKKAGKRVYGRQYGKV